MRDLLDRMRDLERRIALLEATGAAGLSGTDQTIKGSHDRLDNFFGAGSLSSRWYNRFALPSSANSHDREMTADPVGSSGWAWSTAPSSINASSGYNVTTYPHWLYVYIYGSGSAYADLRCTDAGNFPRYKRVLFAGIPSSSNFEFVFRSVVDGNNYIEWLVQPAGASAWLCSGGTRTQMGSTYTLSPWLFPIWLELGNYTTADYLTWGIGTAWGPASSVPPASSATGQRAANVQYIQLLFKQATGSVFERYHIDYVRFGTAQA